MRNKYFEINQFETLTCYLFFLGVYVSGLFIPLMENDSAQHAVMAMRMLQDHNFLELYRGDNAYLDKPHLHFWLSAVSMKVFGINHIAYRLPALLFTCLGAYSTFNLAKLWYKENYGHLAAFVFLSTQAIILSNHDVRTDAVLTGATIFGLWQLILYIDNLKIGNLLLGTLGVAMAFMTKGQLGVFVVSICLLVYLLPHPNLKIILKRPKTYLVIPAFFFFISPVLFAYHHQFGSEGISFILWNQSANRLTGEGFTENNIDYSFFFHTILWAFLPWSLLFYTQLFDRLRKLVSYKGIYVKQNITSIGVLVILIVLSFSSSKLPHYLNSLFPIMSVGVASYLYRLEKKDNRRGLKIWNDIVSILMPICMIGIISISIWSFGLPNYYFIVLYLIIGLYILSIFIKKSPKTKRLVFISVFSILFINVVLNTHFYPNLLKYQSGTTLSKVVEEQNISADQIVRLAYNESWSLDFYTKTYIPSVSGREISKLKGDKWLFIYSKNLKDLGVKIENLGLDYESAEHFRITKLSLKFLNPEIRENVLEKAFLIPVKNLKKIK